MLFTRPDGDRVTDAAPVRLMMPFLMPTRTESIAYFKQVIDITETQAFLAEKNEGRERREDQFTLFHVAMFALVRVLHDRPHMNRFIVGQRIYQRKNIALSFAVKKELSDKGKMTAVKVIFDPMDTFEQCAARINEQIFVGRGHEHTSSEKEMNIVTRLPRPLINLAIKAQRLLDYFNLLPASMIAGDPLYASLFVANLGSIGLESAYHHLYEYGTVSHFGTIGRIEKAQLVDDGGNVRVVDTITCRWTFDERVADGLYASRTLGLFKHYVENPRELMHRIPETASVG